MITVGEQRRIDEYTHYRAYFFGNMYLSSIQQGIQALHVTSELFSKYTVTTASKRMLYRWSINDKTVILLNGGYSETIKNVYIALARLCPKYGFPFAKFHEEKDALNGALTSIGVVLPKQVYDSLNPWAFSNVTDEEFDFFNIKSLLSKAPLAS